MAEEIFCSTCKKRIANVHGTASFKCPNCKDFQIIRCAHCRSIAAKYACPNCGFSGPN
ncbi:MAG TPA: zinc finger domain-containing protein [Candidatus Nanoarchaeia archaeon]|nr:zinc finger domain-containing protein [Candidatus Nanoarchaeia archaeon]